MSTTTGISRHAPIPAPTSPVRATDRRAPEILHDDSRDAGAAWGHRGLLVDDGSISAVTRPTWSTRDDEVRP